MNDQKTLKTEKRPAFAGKKGWLLWIVLLLLAMGGFAALSFFPPLPSLFFLKQTASPLEATESLSGRLTVLEEAIASLPQASENSTAKLNAIEINIASLDSRLAVLENWASQSGEEGKTGHLAPEIEKLQSELRTLSARLADLAQAPKGMAVAGMSMNPRLRAVEELREGLWEYGPFRERLMALLAVVGNNPAAMQALAPIAAYADQGIPTLPMLRARFDAMAAAVLETRWVKTDAGWKERLFANLASFLTIRRTGDVEGDDLEAVLARTEKAVRSGDLERAVSLLGKIEGPGATAAGPWLRDANARLAAAAAVRQLRRLAFSAEKKPTESRQ